MSDRNKFDPSLPAPLRAIKGGKAPEATLPEDLFDEVDDDKAVTRFALTDSGNAERFAAMFADRVRFNSPQKTWLEWDGKRWLADQRGNVNGFAKECVRTIYEEAASMRSATARKAVTNHATKSESRNARANMIALAQSEKGLAVLPSELDADPMLLNVQNGTINLKTGELHSFRREDLNTKICAAPYVPGAKSALWERVLHDAFGGDQELIAFYKRAAGYSITGDTREEKLLMPIGDSRTGKSTTIQAIRTALGDYARTADFEAFIATKNVGGPKNDIARLAGARFVCATEVDQNKQLAEGLIKALTGGDRVTARFLYQEAFEFDPQFKLWLVANHAPSVSNEDEAMWNRIVRIPFDHVVPPEKRDPAVKAELIDPARSGAAILAWLVEGCLEWQRVGLRVPDAVKRATNDYRADQDPLRDFLESECIVDAMVSCTRSVMRTAYEKFVSEAGAGSPISGAAFNDRLRKVEGVREKTIRGTRMWSGIGLLASAQNFAGARVQSGAGES